MAPKPKFERNKPHCQIGDVASRHSTNGKTVADADDHQRYWPNETGGACDASRRHDQIDKGLEEKGAESRFRPRMSVRDRSGRAPLCAVDVPATPTTLKNMITGKREQMDGAILVGSDGPTADAADPRDTSLARRQVGRARAGWCMLNKCDMVDDPELPTLEKTSGTGSRELLCKYEFPGDNDPAHQWARR